MASNGPIHFDVAEVQTTEGTLYLFAGGDRSSKCAVAQHCTS
jgi:hypothetical protein